MTKWAVMVLSAWCGMAALTLWIDRGPIPVEAPSAHQPFAAQRALRLLEQLVGDGIPHPAGSEHNALVVERIVAVAESIGFDVERHQTFHHPWRNPLQAQIPLQNLLFRLEGTHPRAAQNALMLTAHHDSSPQGPGAADDGAGVVILLEVARLLRESPPPTHDIIFLITDGEEKGMLGAERWVIEHPWASDVRMVINVEARGSGGPSLMFQTSVPNRGLIQHFARFVKRPRTSSFFADVYRWLPNNTDLTVYLQQGIPGYNFAFIGNCRNYHTPDDTVENLNAASLQHQGNNVWELAHSLSRADWETLSAPRGNVVYFDVFSVWVVWWPAAWSLPIALLTILPWGAASLLPQRFGLQKPVPYPLWSVLLGGSWHVVVWSCVAMAMGLLWQSLQWDSRLAHPWPDRAFWVIGSCWLVGIAVVLGIVECTRTWCSPNQWLLAAGWTWTLGAVAVSWWLVGASYLWIIPATLTGVALVVWPAQWSSKSAGVAIVLALSVGWIWLPTEPLFYDAIGFKLPSVHIIRWTMVASALAPLFAHLTSADRRVLLVFCAIGWIACTAVIIGMPLPAN